MNTHDNDIHTAIMDVITDVWDRAKQINEATYEVLDLIEADRKRRGEPWMPVESCPGGNGVRYLFVRDCGQGTLPAVEMGYMLDAGTEVYMDSTNEPFTKYGYRVTHWTHLPGLPNTPQPAEPVKKKDWNAELSSWSDEDFVQVFHECPDLADRLRRVLAEPVKKKPYAQGSALGEFGIIPMCDQVDE